MSPNHPLDLAVWTALTTRQAHLAIIEGGVRRFHPDYALFSARGPGAVDADLLALARRTGRIALFEVHARPHQELAEVERIDCVQMTCGRLRAGGPDVQFEVLNDADAPEMLALAARTHPGPFFGRTHQLGTFIGIRRDGRLVAMAGERLRPEGFVEVSGVCTDADHRGYGYARGLMRALVQRTLERGEIAFLHARLGHKATIALYASMGFKPRATPSLVVMEPIPTGG